eukprot:359767-Chlamydomonas_euryale.AAC.3
MQRPTSASWSLQGGGTATYLVCCPSMHVSSGPAPSPVLLHPPPPSSITAGGFPIRQGAMLDSWASLVMTPTV